MRIGDGELTVGFMPVMSRNAYFLYLGLITVLLLFGASLLPSAKLPNYIPAAQFNYPLGLALALAGGLVVALWESPSSRTQRVWESALMTATVSVCCSYLLLPVEDDFARGLISLLPVLWWAAIQNRSGSYRSEHDDMLTGLIWVGWSYFNLKYGGWWFETAFGLLVLMCVGGCRVRTPSFLAHSAGAALVFLCTLTLTSSYRRVKLLGWIYGEFMYIRSLEHEQIRRVLLEDLSTDLWGGADEFLLTVLALEAGKFTAWLTAGLSTGLLAFSILVLAKTSPLIWQRYLGMWIAGYLLLAAISTTLTSLGVTTRCPRTPGLPFFSPGYGIFLWCGVVAGCVGRVVQDAGRQGRTTTRLPSS